MKESYVDFRFEYLGMGIHKSWCVVQVYTHKEKSVVIMTEPGVPDSGTSVTNACEDIATKLYNQKDVFPKGTQIQDILWFETYAERYDDMKRNNEHDRIEFWATNVDETKFMEPDWSRFYTSFDVDKVSFLEKVEELIENSDV